MNDHLMEKGMVRPVQLESYVILNSCTFDEHLMAGTAGGAIEVWGRGTNRVMEACRAYGIADPTFTEASGAVTVTFKAEVVVDLGHTPSQVGPKLVLRGWTSITWPLDARIQA